MNRFCDFYVRIAFYLMIMFYILIIMIKLGHVSKPQKKSERVYSNNIYSDSDTSDSESDLDWDTQKYDSFWDESKYDSFNVRNRTHFKLFGGERDKKYSKFPAYPIPKSQHPPPVFRGEWNGRWSTFIKSEENI